MRFSITLFLLLSILPTTAQEVDVTELDQIFVDNIDNIELNDQLESTANIKWTKEDTASTFISMKEKMKANKGPIMVFVIDGGDIYETENLVNFMNSKEGRSFRVYVNYMIVDSNDFATNKLLRERFQNGNTFLMNQEFKVIANDKIDYYKTKNGSDWWQAIKAFYANNPKAVDEAIKTIRKKADPILVKQFDDSLEKIKNASYRERKKATKKMKLLIKDLGFMLLPICTSKDPEMSHTAQNLLLKTHTGVRFPLSRTIPLWFNIDQQLVILMQK